MATEIAAGVYRLETDYPEVASFPLWLYAVRGDHGWALLDSGISSTAQRVLPGQLAEAGLLFDDLAVLVNSHGHEDHMGGNAHLLAASDAELAAPARDVPWIEDHARYWLELYGNFPGVLSYDAQVRKTILDRCGENTIVDKLLRDGDAISVGGRELEVIETGGHSPGHVALFDRDTGVLFTFDDVQGAGTEWLHGEGSLPPMYGLPSEYRRGLRRLAEVEFEALAPAHGPVLDRAAGLDLIAQSLAWVDEVDALVDAKLEAAGADGVRTRDLAAAIGTELGQFNGVSLQSASVADGHLRERATAGELSPNWCAAV